MSNSRNLANFKPNASGLVGPEDLDLSSGTANGVTYLNGSKVLTSGSALTFDGSSLGIGVSPTQRLTIGGSADAQMTLRSNTTTGGSEIYFGDSDAVFRGLIAYAHSDDTMRFYTSGSEAMRLTSTSLYTASGINVGIGTSSPISKLTVLGAGTINAPETTTTGGSIQTASYGITTRTGNLELGATDALAANIGGSLSFSARYSGTNATWVTGKIGAYRDTATSGVASSYLAFATTTGAGDLTERLRLDSSGNLGLGVTPSAWWSSQRTFQIGRSSSVSSRTDIGLIDINDNNYTDAATNVIYIADGAASKYRQNSGSHQWLTAPSGTAGNAISFTQAMTLDASGNLGIGITNPATYGKLAVDGNIAQYANVGSGSELGRISWLNTINNYPVASIRTFIGAGQLNRGEFGFYTNSGAVETLAMYIDRTQNVGLGTSSPVAPLTVNKGNVTGAGQWASSAIAVANPTNVGAYSQISFGYTEGTTNASAYIGYVSTNQATYGFGDLVFGTRAVSTDTQPTERMRIDSSGNVGIGTPSGHGSKVAIRTTGGNQTALRLDSGANNPENYIALDFGLEGIALSTGYGAFIRGYNYGNNDYRGFLTFGTSAAGGGGTVERARIDHSGQVLIGNTTAALGTGFANRVGRLHVGTSGGSGGFGALAKVASGNSATFVVINNASYRVTVYSTNNSTSARIGQYIFVGLNSVVQNPTVLTVATTGSPNWTFSFSVANSNDTLVTVAASSDNQDTRIIVEQLGDA
jgi:hypothetical protein